MSWQDRAACKGRDPRLWDGDYDYETRKAKEICYSCPVSKACERSAMVNNELGGIWGGYTQTERDGYRPFFMKRYKDDLPALREQYGRKDITLDARYETRLEKARICQRLLPRDPDLELHATLVDLVIKYPDAPAERLAQRVGKSPSTVRHILQEAWEMVS